MKKFTKLLSMFLFSSLSLFALGNLTSCDDKIVIPGPDDGDNPDDGGWDDPWPDPDDTGGEEVIFCEHQCFTCGKCLDKDSTLECCKEKCYELNGRIKYTFNAIDPLVKKVAGSRGPFSINQDDTGGYIGNFSANDGCEIIFSVYVEEDTTACLITNVSQMDSDMYVAGSARVSVNDEEFISRGKIKKSPTGENWVNFDEAPLGCVSLKGKKNNKISFGVVGTQGVQFNFKNISLLSPSVVTLKEANVDPEETHVCESKNSEGLCTDYDCNEYNCLKKDETNWVKQTFSGEDSKIIKKSPTNPNLWNDLPTEQCIGSIFGSSGQTIALSFTLSEDSYVRISLLHNACGVNSRFKDVWDLTFNDQELVTEGKTEYGMQSWVDYLDSTIAYVKGKKGVNTYKMKHKVDFGYNIRSFDLVNQKGELALSQAVDA